MRFKRTLRNWYGLIDHLIRLYYATVSLDERDVQNIVANEKRNAHNSIL